MTFWAHGNHLGEALDKALKSAEAYDIPNPIAVEAASADLDDLPKVAESYDNGETYVHNTIHTFPLEPTYRLPYGVIESSPGKNDYTTEDLTVGYATEVDEEEEDDDLFELRAVVNEEDLLPIYLDLIDALPEVAVFWIKLQKNWENPYQNDEDDDDDSEEIYIIKSLNSRKSIAEFIEHNRRDLLLNGHVTITTYSRTGETNLNISDHKMIVVLTYDEDIVVRMGELLEKRGVYEQYEVVGVDKEFPHMHYRHPQSRDREGLIELLKNEGFEFWNGM